MQTIRFERPRAPKWSMRRPQQGHLQRQIRSKWRTRLGLLVSYGMGSFVGHRLQQRSRCLSLPQSPRRWLLSTPSACAARRRLRGLPQPPPALELLVPPIPVVLLYTEVWQASDLREACAAVGVTSRGGPRTSTIRAQSVEQLCAWHAWTTSGSSSGTSGAPIAATSAPAKRL